MKLEITDAPYCTWITILDQVERSMHIFKKITCISITDPEDLRNSFSWLSPAVGNSQYCRWAASC